MSFRTRIKFCGFTRADELATAVALGVDAVGLVFDGRSKRALSPEQGRALRDGVPAFVSCVALFRDAEAGWVQRIVDEVQPDLLQFHGAETPGFCRRWARPYLKAVPMASPQDLDDWKRQFDDARGLLLDSHAPGELGGSGQAFDWSQAPRDFGRFWVLAGGLAPGNVASAVTMARPDAVDVSSGIESAPGIKDAQKMRAFVEAVRSADSQL